MNSVNRLVIDGPIVARPAVDGRAVDRPVANSTANERPIKVLHIVGSLDRGGVETWLMHVLRHYNQEEFQMDFLVEEAHKGQYDDEAKALGSNIIYCPVNNLISYRRQFLQIMQEHGPYDVVHSHIHNYSGYTLWLAHQAGVPKRIAHSHSDTSSVDQSATWARKLYLGAMRTLIKRHATLGLAASAEAAAALYGAQWQQDPRWQIHYYSIEMEPFDKCATAAEQALLRQTLDIPADAYVVGHVGRFAKQKNHRFLLKIAAEVLAHDPDIYFLLVGDGPLRQQIEAQADELGIATRIRFAGLRADIPAIMCNAMDLFLLPSFYEGLCVVGIEAQAAGLPVVLSNTVTPELEVVSDLFTFRSLQEEPRVWAESILAHKAEKKRPDRALALAQMLRSPFNIAKSIDHLEQIYCN